MRLATTNYTELLGGDKRLDASYHASHGIRVLRYIEHWGRNLKAPMSSPVPSQHRMIKDYQRNSYGYPRVDRIVDVCEPRGIFIGGRAKRLYVDDPEHGIPFLSSSDMLLASFDGVKLISKVQ